jgi:hypothetical protein
MGGILRPSLLLAIPYTPYTLSPRPPTLLVATARLPPVGGAEVISHHPARYRIGNLAFWQFGNPSPSSTTREFPSFVRAYGGRGCTSSSSSPAWRRSLPPSSINFPIVGRLASIASPSDDFVRWRAGGPPNGMTFGGSAGVEPNPRHRGFTSLPEPRWRGRQVATGQPILEFRHPGKPETRTGQRLVLPRQIFLFLIG